MKWYNYLACFFAGGGLCHFASASPRYSDYGGYAGSFDFTQGYDVILRY